MGLTTIPGVQAGPPAKGAMYLLFRIDGSLSSAQQLVSDGKLGLAPGIAFRPEGEGYLRWCFASSHDWLDEGVQRLKRYLEASQRP
ncbi:hypothetical protein [Paraburkholderia caffeinilytica]|nr:hypothetical protein [Paraburkholderia caffeinilytica]CAB3803473.1 hypothetical protein LMG28690_05796 [Paraburkholderia caffeinilytica]